MLELKYILSEREIISGVTHAAPFKKRVKRTNVEVCILTVLAAIFIVSFVRGGRSMDIVMAAICAVIMGVSFFVPRLMVRKQAREATKEVHIKLYPDKIDVVLKNGTEHTLKKDDKVKCSRLEKEKIVLVEIQGHGSIIVPEDKIPVQVRERAISLLMG